MSTLKERIKQTTFAKFIVLRFQHFHPRGFQGGSLYDVGKLFFRGIGEGAVTMRASSLAYNFFLAVFPSIIFLFTLIPYIPISNIQDEMFTLLKEFMPKSAFESAEETLVDIIKKPHSGLLSFGFLTTLYFSTNGFNSMLNGFNHSYHEVGERSALKQRLTSLTLFLLLTLVLIAAITLIIFTEIELYKLRKFIRREGLTVSLITMGRNAIVLLLLFSIISIIYYFGQSDKHKRKFISAGSFFATMAVIITSLGFAYYVNNFGQYNKLYGSIGTLIVILLWIYFNSLALLLGFELNASIDTVKTTKQLSLDV